ncbi:PAS domain-containing protein (plasmid) [Ensifer adhaerens]|uniref:PAS domain-containing protein n=1 Tax=Ensifer adhaerens TaxID=106592 RepID=UPI002797DD32|nr:PAS domain-containing protein [Ensifer adhaerens]
MLNNLYLDRFHPEDQTYVAKQITDTIVGARAQQSIYRVKGRNGQYVSVIVFARCFRDRDDIPVLYSGLLKGQPPQTTAGLTSLALKARAQIAPLALLT